MLVRASAKPLRHCSRRGRRDSSRFVPVIFCALACADLVSCAVGPDYQPPESPLPAKFTAMSSLKGLGDHNANRALETTKWWRTLHDRELDSLVERAIGANPTLEIALDRLQQARAGGSCYQRGAARGGIRSWRRVGHWDRSLPRPRLAGATVRRKPRWRRAGSQSRRLRCSLGDRRFRQISSRNRGGAVRC